MTEFIQTTNIVSELTPWTEVSGPAVIAKIPLVSVAMVTYNHAPYIADAIKGVLLQETNFQIELVIGEDCSTDGTREIVFNYQKKYPNVIRVITSEKNVGGKENSQRIRKSCRGKYIAYCEGDDYWHDPYKLRKQVDYLEGHPECGLVYSDYDVYNEKYGKKISGFNKFRKWEIPENPVLSDFFVRYNRIGGKNVGIRTCTTIVRRNILNQVVESDPFLHQSGHFKMGDTPASVEIAGKARIHYIPESMATYRLVDESATRSKDIVKKLQFEISSAEMFIYLGNKYKISSDIISRYEQDKYDDFLRLAYYTKNENLAEETRKNIKKMNYKKWLLYYGAKYLVIFSICRALILFRDFFLREDDWK